MRLLRSHACPIPEVDLEGIVVGEEEGLSQTSPKINKNETIHCYNTLKSYFRHSNFKNFPVEYDPSHLTGDHLLQYVSQNPLKGTAFSSPYLGQLGLHTGDSV